MSHDIHHDAQHAPIQNVCLTGNVVIAAFITGLVITGIIFWWAFLHHH